MAFPRLRSIRSRLAATLGLGAAVAVVAGLVLWVLVVGPELERVVGREQRQAAERVADAIDQFVHQQLGDLATIAEIGQMWRVDRDRQRELLHRVLKLRPAIHEVALADADGAGYLRVSRYRLVAEQDEVGRLVPHAAEVLRGETHVGEVYQSHAAEPMVTMAVPVRASAREVVAILTAEVTLKTLWRVLSHVPVGRQGSAFVVDGRGVLIAHRDFSRVLLRTSMLDHPAVRRCLQDRVVSEQPVVSAGLDGSREISSCAPNRRVPWVVVVEEPQQTALASLHRLEKLWFVFGAMAVGGALLIAWWFGRRIGTAVVSLEQGVERIARGDLGHRLRADGTDELGAVAQRFNAMADELERSRETLEAHGQTLERRVEERTRELSATSETLASIIRSAPVAMVVADLDGTVRLWNPWAEHVFGWTEAEAVGRPPRAVTRENAAEARALFARVAAGEPLSGHEWRGRRKDGSLVDVALFTALVRAADGRPTSVVGMMVDVSEQKRARELLERANAELEQRVSARTAELTAANVRLRAEVEERRLAELAADRANAAKSEFLSRMSHELRTPLNAVLGFAQVLELDVVEPEQLENVRLILRAGQHLLGLINELLDISRLDRAPSLSLEPVALAEAVETAVALIDPMAADRAVGCQCAVPDDLWVRADPQRLHQVLLNLLSNAVKYNRHGGQVRVGARPGGDRVRLTVADTGVGISADHMLRLFTPFDRLGAERTGVEGTGLGLTLSRRLVELLGGALTLTSDEGQGTTVTLDLPAAAAPKAGDAALEAAAVDAARTRPLAGTVLYIEDTASNQRVLARLLARHPGVTLLQAQDGRTGLRLACERRPDVILLDMHLPDTDGLELLRALAMDPATRDIAVLVLSADTAPARMAAALAAGARRYVQKPIDATHLLRTLSAMLTEDPAPCATNA
jgi:PAS domain S-box-containing protein